MRSYVKLHLYFWKPGNTNKTGLCLDTVREQLLLLRPFWIKNRQTFITRRNKPTITLTEFWILGCFFHFKSPRGWNYWSKAAIGICLHIQLVKSCGWVRLFVVSYFRSIFYFCLTINTCLGTAEIKVNDLKKKKCVSSWWW